MAWELIFVLALLGGMALIVLIVVIAAICYMYVVIRDVRRILNASTRQI